jgi:outer membrane protein assembly factor BamB
MKYLELERIWFNSLNMLKNLSLTLFFTWFFIPLNAQSDWRYDRTGIYAKETGLLKSWSANGPEMLWYFDGLGDGHSSVAISNGKLYVTGMNEGNGFLYVFDRNGKLLDKKGYGAEWNVNYHGTRATPVINEGKIYIVSGSGNIVCFDEKTLNVLWQMDFLKEFDSKNIQWGVNESPLIVGEKLILTPGGKEHNIVALDKNTGKLIWSVSGKEELSAYCSPLYIGEQETPLIVTMTAHHILGLEASTGKLLWSFESRNRNQIHSNTPVYADNMVLCVSVDKGCTMLRLSGGGRKAEIVWEIPELDNMMGGMVKIGDYIYGSSSGYNAARFWYCVDWATGEVRYKDRQLGMGVSIAADGMLYCYTDKGEMALVNPTPEKFDVISQFLITKGTNQHWAHPVIDRGVLYVRHGDSLMAYQISR